MKKFKFFESDHIFKIGKLAFIMLFNDQIPKYTKDNIVYFISKNNKYEAIRLFRYFYWCYKEYLEIVLD